MIWTAASAGFCLFGLASILASLIRLMRGFLGNEAHRKACTSSARNFAASGAACLFLSAVLSAM